jgi:DNA-binding Lrp family transcriptional regulator
VHCMHHLVHRMHHLWISGIKAGGTMSDYVVDKRENGFTRIEEDFIDSVGEFDIYEKIIYMILCRHANIHTAVAFPSYNTIAKKAGCSRRKAIDSVASIVEKGIIFKRPNVNSKGESTSNTYEILGYKNRNLYKLPPKKKENKEDKKSFKNFTERQYDPTELEKILLKKSKGTL